MPAAGLTHNVPVEAPAPARPRWLLWLRAAIVAAVAAYLLTGPIFRQVFRLKVDRHFQRWQMFAGIGRNSCQVEHTLVTPSGGRARIDRDELFGISRSRREQRPERIHRKQLASVHSRVCRVVSRTLGKPADIRARARCGSRGRWVIENRGEDNVCRQ